MTKLSVPDMTCGHCKASVLSALAPLAGSGTVSVDLATRIVTIDGSAQPESLIRALDEIGFPATQIT